MASSFPLIAAGIQTLAAGVFLISIVWDARRRAREREQRRRDDLIKALHHEWSNISNIPPPESPKTPAEIGGIFSQRQIEFFNKRLKEMGERWTCPLCVVGRGRRTTAAQPDLSRMIWDYQFTVTQIRRGVIFLIAFTGLMGAACFNGIPSITCYALADAYTISLGNLGALFLIEFIMISVIVDVERRAKDVNAQTIRSIGLRITMALVVLLSLFLIYTIIQTTIHGVKNTQVAISHCLKDTPQQKHNSYDRIPLLRNLFSGNPT